MKENIVTISVALTIVLYQFSGYAQQYEDYGNNTNIPPGMVMKKMGGRNMVVPYDSWVREEGGGLLVVEDPNEYAARKFMEIDKHLARIDEDLKNLRKETEGLKK